MGTLTDYIQWRGDITFAQSPFCIVDSLALAEVIYNRADGIVPADWETGITLFEAARRFFSILSSRPPEEKLQPGTIYYDAAKLLRCMAKSRRFRDIKLQGFVNIVDSDNREQFSAVTVRISELLRVIVFRGTDGSITGWHENFNMSFKTPVPAQEHSVRYLNSAASQLKPNEKLIVCGHSKGGNLAIWASSHCDRSVASAITEIGNFDGPGFNVDIKSTEGYIAIRDKIKTIVPECSIVGMFFDHEESYSVVASERKGIMQHDGMSWEILGNRFVSGSLSPEIRRVNTTLAAWLEEMDNDLRERFTEGFFEIILSTNAKTVLELSGEKLSLIKAVRAADPVARKAVFAALKLLLGESARSVTDWLKETTFPSKNKA